MYGAARSLTLRDFDVSLSNINIDHFTYFVIIQIR